MRIFAGFFKVNQALLSSLKKITYSQFNSLTKKEISSDNGSEKKNMVFIGHLCKSN